MASTYDIRMRCNAPQEKVFGIVADATTWSTWAGPTIRASWWEREGDPAPGGVGAIRRLGSKQFSTREQITEFDPPYYLAYTILTPTPIRDYRAIVSIDKDGDGCRITWAATCEGRFPGAAPVMMFVLSRVVRGFVKRLVRYAETVG